MHHGEIGNTVNRARTKNEKTELLIGCVIIGAVAIFVTFFSYINEPIGDDILGYYEGALTLYLDDFRYELGEKLTSVPQVMRLLKFTYMNWSGRMTGYFFNYFGKFMPKFVQAILTALVFTANILLTMKIVYKEWIKTLSKPLVFGLIFLALYWYRHVVYYNYMWTMVSVYSFSVMFCLLYYNLAVIDYEQGKKCHIGKLILIGFIAGFSHEVISFCMIVSLGVKWTIDVAQKTETWASIFRHMGFGIGYLFCFFAPGNFYRQTQSHDTVVFTYLERLYNSCLIHIDALTLDKIGGGILLIFTILAIWSVVMMVVQHNKSAIKAVLTDITPLIGGGGGMRIGMGLWTTHYNIWNGTMGTYGLCYLIKMCKGDSLYSRREKMGINNYSLCGYCHGVVCQIKRKRSLEL